MINTDKMTAKEFANWWCLASEERAQAIASRDAYRERQALEAAAVRYRKSIDYCHDHVDERITAAILGEPRFKPGQLVKYIASEDQYPLRTWGEKGLLSSDNYELVLDIHGNPVFLEAPK